MLFTPDLLYLGSKTVELPSFSPLPGCTAPPHPVQGLRRAVTAVVEGRVITCGGELDILSTIIHDTGVITINNFNVCLQNIPSPSDSDTDK